MQSFATVAIAAAALLAIELTTSTVDAHSWLVKPESREKGPRTDVENKLGCPSATKGTPTSYKAGETIDVRYWRNNHLGGFIRWSIVPAGQESKENFDKNAFFYTCRESGPTCLPKGTNQRYSGDSSGDNTISCGDKITLPDYLPAGDYVMQWMWFGVGSSYGNLGWSEPQFKSCADIKLTTSGSKSKPACPTFTGGDRVTKLENKGDNLCFYFHSTDIQTTWYKGDNDKAKEDYKFGIPAPVEKCGGGNDADNDDDGSNSGNSTSKPTVKPSETPSSTSPAPVPVPSPSKSSMPPPTPTPSPSKKICKTKTRRPSV